MKSLKFSTVLVAVALLSTGTQWRKLKSQLQALEITLYSSCNVTVIFHQKKKKRKRERAVTMTPIISYMSY